MNKWVLATHNKHKTAEFRELLSGVMPSDTELVSLSELGLPDIDETGTSFAENAFIKAKAALDATGCISLADDSGLCVDALNGAPGIYSARYGGENASWDGRISKLLAELDGLPEEKRTARFVCSLCMLFPDGRKIEVSGSSEGSILCEKRGSGDFGYDPVFWYPPLSKSFAEMDAAEKNLVSHRGNALRLLEKALSDYTDY